jgi:hypothetical protein
MFDPLDELEAAIDKLAAHDFGVDLMRLRKLADRLEYEWLRKVRAHDRSMDWAADDAVSPAAWLRSKVGVAPGYARATVVLARKLEQFPLMSEAFARGDVARQHASVLTIAATPDRLATLQQLEPELVEAAKDLDPRQFRWLVQHACNALDGDDGAREDAAQFARRYLHASRTFEGMVRLDGLLDHETGETLLCALEAHVVADSPADDGRTPAQRRADALGEIVRHDLACAEPSTYNGRRRGRPHVSVVVDLDELEARAPAITKHVRADLEHCGRVSPTTLQRITCDAQVSRVLTSGRSEPLDVGRAVRTIPPAIWRALVARDGHCQAPGCDRAPGWCEAHHLRHWAHGGSTSLDNLVLLCWRHHHTIHTASTARANAPPSAA